MFTNIANVDFKIQFFQKENIMNFTAIYYIREFLEKNKALLFNNIKNEIKRPLHKCKYENIFDNLPKFEIQGEILICNRRLVPGILVPYLIEQTVKLVISLNYSDALRVFGADYSSIYKLFLLIPNTNVTFCGERNEPAKETENEITQLLHKCKISQENSQEMGGVDLINDLKSLEQFLAPIIQEKKGPAYWEVLVFCLTQTLCPPAVSSNDNHESYNLPIYIHSIIVPIQNFLRFILDDLITKSKRNCLKYKTVDPELDFLRFANPAGYSSTRQ